MPFTIINASDIPELVDIKGGSIDDLTVSQRSGMGLNGEEVLGRLKAAFEASVVLNSYSDGLPMTLMPCWTLSLLSGSTMPPLRT